MLSRIRKLLGGITVTESDTHITVSGLSYRYGWQAIDRVWKTSRITANMFTSGTFQNKVTFPKFFAPEVVYIIDSMLAQKRNHVERRSLAKIRDLLMIDTWLSNTQLPTASSLNRQQLKKFYFTPTDPQARFFDAYEKCVKPYGLRGYLLAAAAGSGKTFTSLALAEMLEVDRIVVVCPKIALYRVWDKSVKELYREPPSHWIAAENAPLGDQRIVIYHYERLGELDAHLSHYQNERVALIVDESHNFNDEKSLRTQQLIEVAKKLNGVVTLPMSGTPFKAMGSEAIPILSMIDPLFTHEVKEAFKKIFGRDGARALDILNHRIGLMSFKVEKHELGLLKPVRKTLPITLPPPLAKQYTLTAIKEDMRVFVEKQVAYYAKRRPQDQVYYDQCIAIAKAKMGRSGLADLTTYQQFVKAIQKAGGDARVVKHEMLWCNQFEKTVIIPLLPRQDVNGFRDVKSIIKYTNLKIQGEALGRILGRKRIQCHVDMVAHIPFGDIMESTEKKTVVFTSFVEALEKATGTLQQSGFNPITVYGKTNRELPQSVAQFEKEEDINPLCATYQSLSTAVPLTMADTMIMIDAPFRAYIQEQAISRIHRLGATTQTTVWECVLKTGEEPNISSRSMDILAWSQEQVSAIMGIESPFSVEDQGTHLKVGVETYGLEEHIEYPHTPTPLVNRSSPSLLMW